MNLNSVFPYIACKELSSVDLPQLNSHQHELSGVANLKEYFGSTERTESNLIWHYFNDEKDPIQDTGNFTFYDSRENNPKRSEWRFYYTGEFLSHAEVGDWFFLIQDNKGQLHALIIGRDSSFLRAAKALFGIQDVRDLFEPIEQDTLSNRSLGFLQRQIIEVINLGGLLPVKPSDEEIVLSEFSQSFPSTEDMSAFARKQVDTDNHNVDDTLACWLDREWELFLALEKTIVGKKLKSGFENVDDFISYSHSVTNRRKSRMGFALEHHLKAIFELEEISYEYQMYTEGKRKPDFIFPGKSEYHDKSFDENLLDMLAAKATCKDRWRQILNESGRIPKKHLCTLEAGISVQQTGEMSSENVTLVIPESLHETYTDKQLERVMSVSEFVGYIRRKQK